MGILFTGISGTNSLICLAISMVFLCAAYIIYKLDIIQNENVNREQRFLNLISKLS